MTTTETATATLRASLYGFAKDRIGLDPDDIPAMVRAALRLAPDLGHDEASEAMNAEADEIRDSHDMEYSVTIREDDRANLFTNVAGWMLEHDKASALLTDTEIVDSAIEDSYGTDPAEVRSWCG